MSFASWHDFYYGAWQWPWALLVIPFLWLVVRSVGRTSEPPDATARFVRLWATLFLLETMLDPVAAALAKDASPTLQTSVSLLFVLAGDFRIYSLVFALGLAGGSLRRGLGIAAAVTAVVPVAAWMVNQGIALAMGEVPSQILYLVHESLFVAACVFLARRWVPANAPREQVAFLQRVLGYAAGYYALWAAADVLILAEVDAGWLVRCVPNQLYYAFTVPVVEGLFRASSRARTSTPVQVDR